MDLSVLLLLLSKLILKRPCETLCDLRLVLKMVSETAGSSQASDEKARSS